MLKTCSVCGKIHDFNIVCKRPYRYKKCSKSDIFRSTYEWKQKREEVKKRDKYLCQACIKGYEGSPFLFNYKDLQVHHIIPIDQDYSKRLDSTNLITLCPLHHKKAEQGIITKDELFKMVQNK